MHWLGDILASATTTVTFFTIFLVGVVFSAFSLIFGGHGHSDHDVSHDVDHDISHDAGGDHDAHDTSGDHADGDAGAHPLNVGLLSVRGVALLSTGFGGIGFLMFATTQRLLLSTATGL